MCGSDVESLLDGAYVDTLLLLCVFPLQLDDHLLFHGVDKFLLVFEALASDVDVLQEEGRLVVIEVAVLVLLLGEQLFRFGSVSPLFHLLLELLLHMALRIVVHALLRAIPLLLQHLVHHLLNVTRRFLFLHLGPLLHDGILELDAEVVFSQGFNVVILRGPNVVVEDVVKREGQTARELVFDSVACSSHVLALLGDLLHFGVGEDEAGD